MGKTLLSPELLNQKLNQIMGVITKARTRQKKRVKTVPPELLDITPETDARLYWNVQYMKNPLVVIGFGLLD